MVEEEKERRKEDNNKGRCEGQLAGEAGATGRSLDTRNPKRKEGRKGHPANEQAT